MAEPIESDIVQSSYGARIANVSLYPNLSVSKYTTGIRNSFRKLSSADARLITE